MFLRARQNNLAVATTDAAASLVWIFFYLYLFLCFLCRTWESGTNHDVAVGGVSVEDKVTIRCELQKWHTQQTRSDKEEGTCRLLDVLLHLQKRSLTWTLRPAASLHDPTRTCDPNKRGPKLTFDTDKHAQFIHEDPADENVFNRMNSDPWQRPASRYYIWLSFQRAV